MTNVRVGALFAGYGGLELALQTALPDLDLEVAWYAETNPAPAAVMAHHHPAAVNVGDVTKANWARLPRVDVLTGGTPCQDVSHAGKRGGFTTGTQSNLWVAMREAVAILRPRVVVWENVRGVLSADADSDLEPCPGCMGNPPTSNMRAFGRVLGDMAALGFRCGWEGIRAADIGAPHPRFRVFVVAYPDR